MEKKAYYIDNIEDYGYFMAFCIEKDISVWRAYYPKGEPKCFKIDWKNKRLFYGSPEFYKTEGYKIYVPKFIKDKYGDIELQSDVKYNIDNKTKGETGYGKNIF